MIDIDKFHIDRSNWEITKFGEVAIQQKQSVDREQTSITRYVKGEHMHTEDIHLREWGDLKDEYLGPAFIRYFEEGDILYGSRRTYLKKVVVAPFEGITSNTTFVIKANESKIDKRLLLYIMLSEGFTEHSIKNSKGSVNPYINWKDIANYEFLLPPKDQQAKLAELLWAMDDVIEKEKSVLENIELLEKSIRNIEINSLDEDEVKLDNLILPMSKIKVGKIEKTSYKETGKYPIVDQSLDFIIGYTDDEELVYKGELPVIVFGDHTTILKYVDFPFVMGADGTKIIKPNSDIDVFYLYQALKKINLQPQGYRRHFSILKNVNIKIPKDNIWIKKFSNKLKNVNNVKLDSGSKIISSKSLQKSLIHQIF